MPDQHSGKSKARRAIIVGCGYVGSRLAAKLREARQKLLLITRTSVPEFSVVEHLQVDLDAHEITIPINADDAHVYYLVPPGRSGNFDTRLEHFLYRTLTGTPNKFVLISTTGVYGNCDGHWVDESAALNPGSDRARKRVRAQHVCEKWADEYGIDLIILRVPGIYGPGRVPVDRIRSGIILPPRQFCGFTNRIHVDDLAAVMAAAAERKTTGIYNVSDGTPLRMNDYFDLVAKVFKLRPPGTSEQATALADLSPGLRSYLRESRKIDNSKMLNDLLPALTYADVETGLTACRNAGSDAT